MKKKIILTLGALFILGMGVFVGVDTSNKNNALNSLIFAEVEALADCEITNKKGEVKFSCKGAKTCSDTALGHTLTCDGTKQ